MELRQILIEVDFINNVIIDAGYVEQYNPLLLGNNKPKRRELDPVLKEKFLETVDPFWHTEKDSLVHFSLYDDGYYFCQRRKLKYDFNTESTYYNDYNFKGATREQAEEFARSLEDLREVVVEVKNLVVENTVKEIDKEVIFYEQRYFKIRRQRESLLNNTDFRVLPDFPESYEGEKDQWIAWRKYIREDTLKKPSDPMFHDENGEPSGLAYWKYTCDIKFPVDPKIYRRMYPNGFLDDGVTPAPAFMDVNDPDQWVKQEVEASTDFFNANEMNMYNLAGRGTPAKKRITENVLSLMKELAVDDIIPVDWDRYFTDDSQLTE